MLFTSSNADSVVAATAAAIESLVVSHDCGRDSIALRTTPRFRMSSTIGETPVLFSPSGSLRVVATSCDVIPMASSARSCTKGVGNELLALMIRSPSTRAPPPARMATEWLDSDTSLTRAWIAS